ncbi:MAG: hypothetical protein AAF480_10855 [Actinomycetota bacterium]
MARVALFALILLAGVAALVLPRLDEGPLVVCRTDDDALVSCVGDENGRFLADSLVVAGMLASTLLVLRTGRNRDEAARPMRHVDDRFDEESISS